MALSGSCARRQQLVGFIPPPATAGSQTVNCRLDVVGTKFLTSGRTVSAARTFSCLKGRPRIPAHSPSSERVLA